MMSGSGMVRRVMGGKGGLGGGGREWGRGWVGRRGRQKVVVGGGGGGRG